MNGTTLPRMSSDGTPGYPAPDTACIVETTTARMPNGRSGASAIASTTVEQFGLVTMAPGQPFCARCSRQQLQVVGVDLGDEERHQRIHPVVARVADDDVPGGGEGAFDLAGHRGVEAREHDLRSAARRAGLDHAGRGGVGNRRGQAPGRHAAVGLALRALAGRQPGEVEPRMRGQAGHELLPDHSRGTQDTDVNRSHEPTPFADSIQKQKTRLGMCRGGLLVARGEGRSMADRSVARQPETHRSRRGTGPLSRGSLSHLDGGHCARV